MKSTAGARGKWWYRRVGIKQYSERVVASVHLSMEGCECFQDILRSDVPLIATVTTTNYYKGGERTTRNLCSIYAVSDFELLLVVVRTLSGLN